MAVARDILSVRTPEAAAVVVELALGVDADGQPIEVPPAVRLAAAQAILDRALGRAQSTVTVQTDANSLLAQVLARRTRREAETIDVTPGE
jgi:hypothetical protein